MKVKSQKGFTLIELLIVIAVLGILAAIVVPQLIQFTSSANVGAANAELGVVNTAVQAGMADYGVSGIDENQIVSEDDADIIAGIHTIPVDVYIHGGSNAIKGIYYLDIDGFVTDASYPEVTSFADGRFYK